MTFGDTIAAIATAPGRGGVAVIRVSGPEAFVIAEQLTGKKPEPGKIFYGTIYSKYRNNVIPELQNAGIIDSGIILAFRSPHSYTGEDVVEFQCHGGTVTPRRVLEACLKSGARLARRGEFTERAFLNGRLDYNQAEAVLDLINARTDRAANAALAGLSGRTSRAYRELYETALDLSTRVEYSLDVDEGELPSGFGDEIKEKCDALRAKIDEAIRRAHEGRLLREGALVVLAGPPNAGKSSLLNALLDAPRAIVSDIPGTTRDTIEEGLNLSGWPIRLVDTAGLRETDDVIETEGVKRSEDLIAQADVVVALGEKRDALRGKRDEGRTIFVHAKCDLGRGEDLNVSAKTGEGLEALKDEIVRRLESGKREEGRGMNEDNTHHLSALHEAHSALLSLNPQIEKSNNSSLDLVLTGNALRQAADRLGSLVGAVYSADFLNNLFSRFCVGK